MCWVNAKSAGNGCRARMLGPPLSISQYSSAKDRLLPSHTRAPAASRRVGSLVSADPWMRSSIRRTVAQSAGATMRGATVAAVGCSQLRCLARSAGWPNTSTPRMAASSVRSSHGTPMTGSWGNQIRNVMLRMHAISHSPSDHDQMVIQYMRVVTPSAGPVEVIEIDTLQQRVRHTLSEELILVPRAAHSHNL